MRHHGRQKVTTATFVLRCDGFTMTATRGQDAALSPSAIHAIGRP
jgi:hypothetical protein